MLSSPTIVEIREGRKSGIHVGTAGLMNLDFVGKEGALFFDVNGDQRLVWDAVNAALVESPTRDGFPTSLLRRIGNKEFNALGSIDEFFENELQRQDGWLGTDERYAEVRSLAEQGRLVFVQAAIEDRNRWEQIAEWLEREGLPVSTVFLSNIPQYASRPRRTKDPFYAGHPFTSDEVDQSIAALSNGQDPLLIIEAAAGIVQTTPFEIYRIRDEVRARIGRNYLGDFE